MGIEQGADVEGKKLGEEILGIHDWASEIRGACYGQFIH